MFPTNITNTFRPKTIDHDDNKSEIKLHSFTQYIFWEENPNDL